uniref:GNAT family N-acetyltransferase n=1 Tax=Ningiella ruwaisensis TaxID=2364274 RepID=UPI0010A0A38F|nr:GNAT family N-acetyltransferase [Ningiella ruwaisensis]
MSQHPLSLICKKVDYTHSQQTAELLDLLQAYALDPMGGAKAIPDDVLQSLPSALQKRSFMFSIIVYLTSDDANTVRTEAKQNLIPIAFANCIESFSTFKAKAVINIHDFAVLEAYRGKGVSKALIRAIEEEARQRNACKLTLEVLSKNDSAKNAYKKAGFEAYELDPASGQALFWEKPL